MTEMIKFDLPKSQSSIIKVIGVGGGGSNAVNHMFRQGIEGVDFIVCNTDAQALDISPVPVKVQLGASLTEGRGAGSIPAVGKSSAIENVEQLRELLEKNTKMLFITAGMGGGTGTGAAPVIAATAKEMGILTVAIVTVPFSFEGRKRRLQAEEGINELRKNVDTLLVICNDKLRELHGNLCLSEAFGKADNILTTAAKGIAEIITVPGYINVDFEDVKTVMKNSGVAIMGAGIAEGEDRALKAVELALSSPLLNESNIKGASNILLYIASGTEEITMDEVSEITEYIQNESGSTAEIIWGNGTDESLGNKITVTLVATGFSSSESYLFEPIKQVEKVVTSLDHKEEVKIVKDFDNPVSEQDLNDFKILDRTSESIVEQVKESLNIQPDTNVEQSPKIIFQLDDDYPSVKNTSFEIDPVINEPVTIYKPEPVAQERVQTEVQTEKPIEENMDALQRRNERVNKLRELSIKIKSTAGLSEVENEPAYKRKNIQFADVTPSSESHISRFSLNENEDNKTELKSNNSFLHDNVD
jgi:cell division protein FtsZ